MLCSHGHDRVDCQVCVIDEGCWICGSDHEHSHTIREVIAWQELFNQEQKKPRLVYGVRHG